MGRNRRRARRRRPPNPFKRLLIALCVLLSVILADLLLVYGYRPFVDAAYYAVAGPLLGVTPTPAPSSRSVGCGPVQIMSSTVKSSP